MKQHRGAGRLRVVLPQGRRAAKVSLLVSGETVQIREETGALSLVVPSIAVHEVIAIDLT